MWRSSNFTVERYDVLKRRHNFYPDRILDIGANIGQWYREIQTMFPDSEVFSIEANPNCEHQLMQINPNYLITFLGKEESTTDFYIPKNNPLSQGGSSYIENSNHFNEYETQQLPVITLDSLNQEFDFIKMDVQGAELDIIKGGLKTILNSSILQLELGVLDYNIGSPQASEIISYLYNLDFHLFDIGSLYYWDGYLNQSDMFFINKRKLPNFSEVLSPYRYV
jgi:FkbM family methyltransferase